MNSHYEAFTGTPLLAVDVIIIIFYPQTPAVCLLLEKAAL